MRLSLPAVALASALALGSLTLDACASSGAAKKQPAPRRSASEITFEQLEKANYHDAYEAVETLHSNWMQSRGTDSFQAPSVVLVYLDDTRLGGVETLRGIAARTIGYIQHYDGISATARWGLNHGAGVIYVSSRRK